MHMISITYNCIYIYIYVSLTGLTFFFGGRKHNMIIIANNSLPMLESGRTNQIQVVVN